MPDGFIGLVEDASLVVPVGWRVIERACNQLATWQKLFPLNPPLVMNVHVSGKLLFANDMPKRLAVLPEDCGVPRGSLHLEIIERVVMDHEDLVLSLLADLRDIGIELHIDDFGNGYSSLSYLQQFMGPSLKIHGSFVSTLSERVDSSAIIEAIIKPGSILGMKVIAKGVETPKQLSRLHAMNCPEAQGFLFSGPLHHDAVNDYITSCIKLSCETEDKLTESCGRVLLAVLVQACALSTLRCAVLWSLHV